VRYLVTGHTGFKGAWLCLLLAHRGHEVHGLALDPPRGGIFERAAVRGVMSGDVRGDIRDSHLVQRVLESVRPEVVMHLAAQPLVRESLRDPRSTMETNVVGTLNVIEAVASLDSVLAQLVVTTDKVYRNEGKAEGYVESDPLGGADPYSASKAMAEILVAAMVARGGLCPTATARAGNVVGGGDVSVDRLVPDLVRAFETGEVPRLRYPDSVRPWQYVLDVLSGYLMLVDELLRGKGQQAWNFGPRASEPFTVANVAERVAELYDVPVAWEREMTEQPPESTMLTLDSERARVGLGWIPRLTLEQALQWTVEWHRQADADEAREVSISQIRRFEVLGRTT
jgi:CDP-glucose 4,6-dehydratase